MFVPNLKLNKMETIHTKGEWVIIPMTSRKVVKTKNGNKCIADIWGSTISDVTDSELEANAKLIAAAPELLDVLIALMYCYEKNGQLLSFNVDIARQAILKATE